MTKKRELGEIQRERERERERGKEREIEREQVVEIVVDKAETDGRRVKQKKNLL